MAFLAGVAFFAAVVVVFLAAVAVRLAVVVVFLAAAVLVFLAGAAARVVAAAFFAGAAFLAGAAFFAAVVVFLAAAVLVVAAARLAGAAFLAVAPAAALAAVVAVPAAARAPATAALGSFLGLATTSLKPAPARNFGTLVLRMRTVSPVRGLRPVRAARADFSKVPKPVMATLPPLATSRMITSTTWERASLAALRLPSRFSSSLTSSALFTSSPPQGPALDPVAQRRW